VSSCAEWDICCNGVSAKNKMFSIILKQEWISKEYQNKVIKWLIVVNYNTLLHESECEFTKLPYGHNQGTKKNLHNCKK
jgi:hypothetical protein